MAGLWPLVSHRNAEFINNEVPGIVVPQSILDRMRRPAPARRRSRRVSKSPGSFWKSMKGMIQGVQISAPFGRVQYALDVLKG